jgi:nucleoside-diphosphate-sugar epimerase
MLINKGSTRNLLWIEDAFFIVDYIIRNNIYSNEIVNVSSPYNIYVIELVSKIEKILQKKAKYELVSQGKNQEINIDKILSIQCLKNLFEDKYIDNVLEKFYKDVFLKTNY